MVFFGFAQASDSRRFVAFETTIAEAQEAIRTGSTTCREIVTTHLARIDAYDELLNAITVINPEAVARADEIDAALAAGDALGPLFFTRSQTS